MSDDVDDPGSVVEGLSAARNPALSGHDTESGGNGAVPSSKEKFDVTKHPHPLVADMKHVFIDKDCMRDPVIDVFYLDTWHAVAEKNTKLFRSVFRCMPDSEVKSWKEYKDYADYGERFAEMQNQHSAKAFRPAHARQTGPPGTGASLIAGGLTTKSNLLGAGPNAEGQMMGQKDQSSSEKIDLRQAANTQNHDRMRSDIAQQQKTLSSKDEKMTGLRTLDAPASGNVQNGRHDDNGSSGEDHGKQVSDPPVVDYSEALNRNATAQSRRRRRRATTLGSKREFHASDEVMDKQQAEDLLNQVQGHLILWPYDWLVELFAAL